MSSLFSERQLWAFVRMITEARLTPIDIWTASRPVNKVDGIIYENCQNRQRVKFHWHSRVGSNTKRIFARWKLKLINFQCALWVSHLSNKTSWFVWIETVHHGAYSKKEVCCTIFHPQNSWSIFSGVLKSCKWKNSTKNNHIQLLLFGECINN